MTHKQIFEQAHKDGYWWAEEALLECKNQGRLNMPSEEESLSQVICEAFIWRDSERWEEVLAELGEEEIKLKGIQDLRENAQYFLDKMFEANRTATRRLVGYLGLEDDIQIVSPALTHYESREVYNLPCKVLLSKQNVDFYLKNN